MCLSGEIPILFDYDFNAYRAQYTDKAPVQFVIPREGTQQLPYVMGLVARGPNPEQGKKMLDFLLSDEGQRHWANAFLRPVFPAAMSAEVRSRFVADSRICARAADRCFQAFDRCESDRRAVSEGRGMRQG